MHRTYCKCRKTEPVYPFASFITGNWRLNVRKKERKINVCMYTLVLACACVRTSVFACIYIHTYIMRLCQMADARRRNKGRRRDRRTLSLLPAACRPCPVTSHFSFLHSSSFVVVLHQPSAAKHFSTLVHVCWRMNVCLCECWVQHLRTSFNKSIGPLSCSQYSCFTVQTRDFGIWNTHTLALCTLTRAIIMMTVAKRNKQCLAPMCTHIHSHHTMCVCIVDAIINKSTKQNKLWILV